jgi:putative ABC transport system substrate-binding protein
MNLKSKTCAELGRSIQNLKWGRIVAIGVALALCGAVVEAQQPKRNPRIGFLTSSSASANANRVEAFQRGLRDLGYVEGQNIAVEYRYAEGKFDRLAGFGAELVRLKVDVIVTTGDTSVRAVKKATETIPIVTTIVSDPVALGFVISLARPGGNITGLTSLAPELGGKRLELLKEAVPRLSRVAVLGNRNSPGYGAQMKEIEVAAKELRMQVQTFGVQVPNDFDKAFSAMSRETVHAIIVIQSPAFSNERARLVDLAVKNRLPVMYPQSEFAEAGGLMSYGPSVPDLFRRAATYVDKILKGTKPADLPVEQPTKFELVINLKTAKQIGLTIPPNVLARADRVIQ